MKPQNKPARSLILGQLFDREAQKLTGVSARTFKKWKSGASRPPTAALELLRLHAEGRTLPDAWAGFHFDATGRLFTPYAETIGPDDVLRMFWYMQELRRLRCELRRLTDNFDLTPKPKDSAPALEG